MNVKDGYAVAFNEINSWEDINFQGEIVLTNNSSDALEAWELTVDTNFTIEQITNSWAADVTKLDEGKYLLKGTYNSIIQPYSSVALGFQGVKNETPEISDYSLSAVSVDEVFLASIISNGTENEPLTELSMYASGNVKDNELSISWIPDKEVSGVEYKVFESFDGQDSLCIASTNDLAYVYTLENNFISKRVYVEAYYNDSFIGKSNEFMVQNIDGVFSSEIIDTDGDKLSDYIEEIIGTDPNKSDTDEDDLDDYIEFFILETDPLKTDSDDNGILDGDEDCDADGLTNSEEFEKTTSPVNSDSDNDNLSDYDELFIYNTNPNLEDTDMDGLNDYDEVMLDINPNDSTDSGKVVKQKIDTDDECLNGVNVEGLPYDVSMEIKASGYVAGSLKADNSLSYSSTYSFDTIGEIPEFSYDSGNVEEVTLNFEFDEEYIAENEIDFDALNIFKYYDEVNMFIPLKTVRNEDEKILSCESESLGTFCVKDINEWFLNFTDSSSESEENISFLSSDSNIMAKSIDNETILLNSADTEIEPVNVVFAVDKLQFMGMMSFNRPTQIKQNIINVSEQLFKRYKNVKIYLVYYDNASYIEICDNIDSVKESVNGVPFLITQSLSQCIEKPINDVKMLLSNMAPNYYFIYNGTYFNTNPPQDYREQFELNLKQEKSCHMCFVSAGCMLDGDYIDYYAHNYEGKVFNLFSETIDDDVLNFIAKESKLQKNSSYVTPGAGDTPSEDEPVNTEPSNRYVISSNLTTVTLDAPLTKNSKVDSDNDGLTDVEELIQSEELVKWDTDGNIILPTLNEVIRYCGLYAGQYSLPDDIMNYDLYHDYLNCKVLPVKSNPTYKDSDIDGYEDYDELINHKTNPLKYNELISYSDVEFISDSNRFAASACRDYNDESLLAEISVFIANNIFGSTHNYTSVYKGQIVEYLQAISDDEEKNPFDITTTLYYTNIGTQIEALLDRMLVSAHHIDDPIIAERIKGVIEAFAEERVLLIRNLRNNKITMEQFITRNDELFEYAWNNEILVKYFGNSKYRDHVFKSVLKIGEKANYVVTYGSIIAGGATQVTKSMFDLAKIIEYETVIRNNTDILNDIIITNKSDGMKNAARDLLYDIQNQSALFYNELSYLVVDTELVVADGLIRVKIASCCSAATVVIAEIALLDQLLGISDIGTLTLKCYTFATISESISKKIEAKSRYLDKSGEQYEYTFVGDYVLYKDIAEYKILISNLCVSRIKGEESVLAMIDNGSVNMYLSFIKVDKNDYSISIESTKEKVKDIKNKYITKEIL